MSLLGRIQEASNTSGFAAHPVGTFPGQIAEISQREHDGRTLWEVRVKTSAGSARYTVWHNTIGQLDQTDETAVDRYVKGLGRLVKLYRELGLQEPTGQDEVALEEQIYGRLGEWINRSCTVVVKANERDARNPYVFINAPDGDLPKLNSSKNGVAANTAFNPTGISLNPSDIPF